MASHFTDRRALAVTLCWVAGLALTGSTEALLFLAPALLIAIPLIGGRYIGEELVAKLASGRRSGRVRSAAYRARPLAPAPPTWPARGARLIALSLAKRPPPAALLPQN
jgi:hypothetical protein